MSCLIFVACFDLGNQNLNTSFSRLSLVVPGIYKSITSGLIPPYCGEPPFFISFKYFIMLNKTNELAPAPVLLNILSLI